MMLTLLCGMGVAVYANNSSGKNVGAGEHVHPAKVTEPGTVYRKDAVLDLDINEEMNDGWESTTGDYSGVSFEVYIGGEKKTTLNEDSKTYTLPFDCRLKSADQTEIINSGTCGLKSGTGKIYLERVEQNTDRENQAIWRPTTPEDLERYSYCLGEPARLLPGGDGAEICITNTVQGPKCIRCMKEFKPEGYVIGATYNIVPGIYEGTRFYHSDKKYTFTVAIPESLQKEGRSFRLLCISKDGIPFLYGKDTTQDDGIRITTDRFYAYALLYSDQTE